MDDHEIKLRCLEMTQANDTQSTIENAKKMYDWVMESEEKPKQRGRPPKPQQ